MVGLLDDQVRGKAIDTPVGTSKSTQELVGDGHKALAEGKWSNDYWSFLAKVVFLAKIKIFWQLEV